MKRVLAFLLDYARAKVGGGANTFHDDRLRANQFDESANTFSYWRALVS